MKFVTGALIVGNNYHISIDARAATHYLAHGIN
jgi:hypothetical protein